MQEKFSFEVKYVKMLLVLLVSLFKLFCMKESFNMCVKATLSDPLILYLNVGNTTHRTLEIPQVLIKTFR